MSIYSKVSPEHSKVSPEHSKVIMSDTKGYMSNENSGIGLDSSTGEHYGQIEIGDSVHVPSANTQIMITKKQDETMTIPVMSMTNKWILEKNEDRFPKAKIVASIRKFDDRCKY